MMSMPASLIGFAIFKALEDIIELPLTPVENVLVQTVAVAVGSMPLSAGFVGVIPALEKLLKPIEGGPILLSTPELVFWGFGVAFFGVFFAVPLRKQVIIREKLTFPSGTATALMISVLHGTDEKSPGAVPPDDSVRAPVVETTVEEEIVGERDFSEWKKKTRVLLYSFAVGGVYVCSPNVALVGYPELICV
jgi:uncharacterized oligopeptide transporter (OPT) family protein